MADGTIKIVVIGGGPGGYVAALHAARHGAVVTLVENDLIGGTCLNRGCIPTKALLASAEALSRARAGEEYGFEVSGEIRPDFGRMMARKDGVVTRLRENVEILLKKAGVTVLRGRGRLDGPGRVTVELADGGTTTVDADKVVLATGSEPARLPMFDFDHPNILTSTEALALDTIPVSLLIVGAGVIGCEFASFYNELGAKITMVEMLPQMLPLEDLRLAKQFQSTYRKRGINVMLKTKVESITEYADDHVTAKLSDGSEVTAEKILVSVGRKPNSAGIGLETVGRRGRPAWLRGRRTTTSRRLPPAYTPSATSTGARCLLTSPRTKPSWPWITPWRRPPPAGGRATCAPRLPAPTPRPKSRVWV